MEKAGGKHEIEFLPHGKSFFLSRVPWLKIHSLYLNQFWLPSSRKPNLIAD